MSLTKSTFFAKQEDHLLEKKDWVLIDAAGIPLGKVAVLAANKLRGKDRVDFTANVDTGTFVIVTNAKKVKLSGAKLDQKIYYRHSGYIGHLKSFTAREMLEKDPTEVIRLAVARMLPKNRLASRFLTKLKIYPTSEHRHEAQKPLEIKV
ncbi:MAG: 50S ribosomal protein L13 [Nitrospinota bacterium]